jgi:hypothetical protein
MALLSKAGVPVTRYFNTYTFIKKAVTSNLPDFVNITRRPCFLTVSHSQQHLEGGDMALLSKAGVPVTQYFITYTFIR